MARKLLEDGRKNEANRAEQFVLLRRAGEIARDAGEADLMLEAVDAIVAAGFDIRPFPVKARLLKQLVAQTAAGGGSQLSTVSACCVKFAEEAAANGAVEEASDVLDAAKKSLPKSIVQAQAALRAAKAALARARTAADKAEREKKLGEAQAELDALKSAQTALAECAKGLQQAQREHEAIQAAQERLKTAPDDPEACLTVGRWHCFYQGDWDEGLKLLAKGSDDALKSLAAEELAAKPAKAEDKVARGDAWWDLAEKATGKAKAAMRRRAGQWYQEALPDLAPGLGKSRVEKRLAQAADEPLPERSGRSDGIRPPLAVAPFNEKTAQQHQARWAKYLHVPVVANQLDRHEARAHPAGRVPDGLAQGTDRRGVAGARRRRLVQGPSAGRGAAAPGADYEALLAGRDGRDAGGVPARDGQQSEQVLKGTRKGPWSKCRGTRRWNSAGGCRSCLGKRRPSDATVCRPRRSGSMPAVRERRPAGIRATTRRDSVPWRGTTRTQAVRRTRWGRNRPTPGGCMTCTETYGSGARIGMTRSTMRSRLGTIPRDLPGARTAWTAAVAGTSRRGAAGRRAATWTGPGTVTSTWASASPEFRRRSRASERSRCAARAEARSAAGP